MKRIIRACVLISLLMTACTNANDNITELLPTPTETVQQNKASAIEADEPATENDGVIEPTLTNAEEALIFLEKASEIASSLKTITFSSMSFNTSYSYNLDEPDHNYFSEYKYTLDGTLQRDPKLAYLVKTYDNSSGQIASEDEFIYDESSQITYTNREYFDPALGWFSVSDFYSYSGNVSDDNSYISHNELDQRFRTLEHIDRFFQLFMKYPEGLSIIEDGFEGSEGELRTVQLELNKEQYMENLMMLEFNFFTGSFIDPSPEEFLLDYVETEYLRDLYLALTFDQAHNLVQLTVSHTTNALQDYVDENRNDYWTTYYSVYFYDHNVPYSYSIPEEVILNADYQ